MTAGTVNQRIADAIVGHEIDMHRYANGVVRRLMAILNRADSDLLGQITGALERLDAESFTVARLEQLLGSVRAINARVYEDLTQALAAELRATAEYESGYQLRLFESAVPSQVVTSVGVSSVSVEQVYAAAFARPFQGRLLSEWASKIEADRMWRVREAVRMGFIEGQTTSQIVQRIRGTRANGYSDGVIDIDRRNAESVIRTAVSHTAAYARNQVIAANADIVKAVVWTSTLDNRTSQPCRLRDGKQYTATDHKPIGHKLPWGGGPGALHWCCRSTSTPVTKSFRELGIDLGEFSPATRAAMDGQVPTEQTYGEWLRRQSAARQDDILGPTRGKLFRDGGLTLDRFANDRGRWLDLEELKQRDAAAFAKAGV